ncbi:MAG: hypothetical protein ABIF77_20450 [bacterium]
MTEQRDIYRKLLQSYEDPAWRKNSSGERIFRGALGSSLLLAVGLGFLLLAVDLPPLVYRSQEARRATLLIEEPEPGLPVPKPEEPEDLSATPELAQEEAAPAIEPPPAEEPPEPASEPEPEPRRVYGVRKVFAHGLGQGVGGGTTGIVSKRGNTLDKDPDDLVANEADLTGELAPLSTVSSAPVLIGRIKPEYTEEML